MPPTPQNLHETIERNIQTLTARRQANDRRKTRDERLADHITGFAGTMKFVYLHLVVFGIWIVFNLHWVPWVRPFDPSFSILAVAASVEAIFLSTFVMISQNRMSSMADKLADLDLHIGLLAEHEVTRMLALLTAVAKHLGVEAAHDPELADLAKDVVPDQVIDRMEAAEREAESSSEPRVSDGK
jgi:uncharacterized membrane protein